jgi:YNFM family putative membrane transporter
MLPLGFAPILYGYILESFSLKRFLRIAVLILGVLELAFAYSDSYFILLSIRGLQGLLIPAILTSLMSYISFITPKEHVQQAMGYYIAATIFGGFIGRLLSGLSSDIFGWRAFFIFLGFSLIVVFWLLSYIQEEARVDFVKPKLKQILEVLHVKTFLNIYLMMFFIFFVFQAVLNFLPFQLQNISSQMGFSKVGLMYAGYIIGFVISMRVLKLIGFFKTEQRAIIAGIVIYTLGLQMFHISSYSVMFVAMFVLCAGFFIIHAVASGLISKLAHERRAISNGLYLSFYYAGGAVGTFAPGVFFEYLGWHVFILLLSFIILSTLFFALKVNKN